MQRFPRCVSAISRTGVRFAASHILEVRKVGVVGLGLMGHGIVQVSAANGIHVVAVDATQGAVDKGLDMIKKSLETISMKSVQKGTLSPAAAKQQFDETMSRIVTTTNRADLGACDLIIEAVPETMEIKTPLYRDLAQIARPDAIIASNTSGLRVGDMAQLTGRMETTIGLHYFNPVQLMQLVEVVKLDTTPQSVIDVAFKFVKQQKKTPVLCTDTAGFIVNRLLIPYMAQAFLLVESGAASFRDVDTAMKLGAGYPMGPFQLADYVGLDTVYNVLNNWRQMFPGESAFVLPKSLEAKVKAGKFGRKTGEGFYKWSGNQIVS